MRHLVVPMLALWLAACARQDPATANGATDPSAAPHAAVEAAVSPAVSLHPIGCDASAGATSLPGDCPAWDTGFGRLEVAAAGPGDASLPASGPRDDYDRHVLRWRGQSIAAFQGESVTLMPVPAVDGGIDVVVDAFVPGLNCRHEYRVLGLSADGRHVLSPVFGECHELLTAERDPNGLRLVLDAYVPDDEPAREVEYLWHDGQLELIGEVSDGSAPPKPGAAPALVLSAEGVGPVRLGMSLDDARRALPDARLTRDSDGEGVALVAVQRGARTLMVLYAGEEDAEAPLDGAARIESIQTFDPSIATTGGVAVGWRVADAAKVYGPVREVWRSEIEQREYVQFARQPAELTFRIDYTGEFAPGENRSTRYATNARIHSIQVDAPPGAQ
jgi:hypothetical protein